MSHQRKQGKEASTYDRDTESSIWVRFLERIKGKPRLRWTPELHQRFAVVVQQLGGPDEAKPTAIMQEMGVPGLEMSHIKSHLQKYRLNLKSGKEKEMKQPEDGPYYVMEEPRNDAPAPAMIPTPGIGQSSVNSPPITPPTSKGINLTSNGTPPIPVMVPTPGYVGPDDANPSPFMLPTFSSVGGSTVTPPLSIPTPQEISPSNITPSPPMDPTIPSIWDSGVHKSQSDVNPSALMMPPPQGVWDYGAYNGLNDVNPSPLTVPNSQNFGDYGVYYGQTDANTLPVMVPTPGFKAHGAYDGISGEAGTSGTPQQLLEAEVEEHLRIRKDAQDRYMDSMRQGAYDEIVRAFFGP